MRRRSMIGLVALGAALGAGCADTDVENTEEAREALGNGEGVELNVQPVDLENQRWFQEGRTVEFGGRDWLLTGEPMYDIPVAPVGEFEGMTLFAETGVTGPHSELFIPLEDDYWQRLTPTGPAGPDEGDPDVPQGTGGIDQTGDPRDDADDADEDDPADGAT